MFYFLSYYCAYSFGYLGIRKAFRSKGSRNIYTHSSIYNIHTCSLNKRLIIENFYELI